MPLSSRTFRLFVSSTFTDWQLERNALQLRVWPELEKLCAAHNCRFQAIDLRWGISEEASRAARTMTICLGEIDRCQRVSGGTHVLALLGDRYGYRPVPEAIPDLEFQALLRAVEVDDRPPLVGRAGQGGWYERDDNALDADGRPGVWQLLPWPGRAPSYDDWAEAEDRLRTTLVRAATVAALQPHQAVRYGSSATEQEFERALINASASVPIMAFARTMPEIPDDDKGRQYADWLPTRSGWIADVYASKRLSALRGRVRREEATGRVRLHHYDLVWSERSSAAYLDRFCADVRTVLEERIRVFLDAPVCGQGEGGTAAQEDYRDEQARGLVGREAELARIAA